LLDTLCRIGVKTRHIHKLVRVRGGKENTTLGKGGADD